MSLTGEQIEREVKATTLPIETMVRQALEIDRPVLNRLIGMMESEIGISMRKDLPSELTLVADSGIAMLKLTAFYLDELHKLFPDGRIP